MSKRYKWIVEGCPAARARDDDTWFAAEVEGENVMEAMFVAFICFKEQEAEPFEPMALRVQCREEIA